LFGVFLTQDPRAATEAVTPRGRLLESGRRLIRFGGEISLDVVLATIALFSAFLIRFDTLPVSAWIGVFLQAAPIVVSVQLLAFVVLGVYRTLWSYLGITDILLIVRAALIGTLGA